MSRCLGSWGARRAARGWAGWSSAGSSGSPAGGFSTGDAVQTRLTADPRNTNGSLFKTELEKAFSLIIFVFCPNLSRWVTNFVFDLLFGRLNGNYKVRICKCSVLKFRVNQMSAGSSLTCAAHCLFKCVTCLNLAFLFSLCLFSFYLSYIDLIHFNFYVTILYFVCLSGFQRICPGVLREWTFLTGRNLISELLLLFFNIKLSYNHCML